MINKTTFFMLILTCMLTSLGHVSAMEEREEFTENLYLNVRAPQVTRTQTQTVINLINLYENSPVFVRVKTGDSFANRNIHYMGPLNPYESIEIPRPKFGTVTLHFFDDFELTQSLGTQLLKPEELAGLRSITVLVRGNIRTRYRNGLGLEYLYDFIGAPCDICFDNVQPEETVKALACGHEFHQYCVNNWLERELSCPKCRKAVTKVRDSYAQVTVNKITQ